MQFRRLTSKYFVQTLLLPLPQNDDERSVAGALQATAEENGTGVVWYDASICDNIRFNGLTFELPARTYIKRSPHPVITLRVAGSDADLLYLSGGADEDADNERYILRDSWARKARGVIFGAHSPKIKQQINFGGFDELELAVFASGDIKEAAISPVKNPLPPDAVSITLEDAGTDFIEFVFSTGK